MRLGGGSIWRVAIACAAVLGVGAAVATTDDSDDALRTHDIEGVVTVRDSDGACVRSDFEERCAKFIYPLGDLPAVGDGARGEYVVFPDDDDGVLLWRSLESA